MKPITNKLLWIFAIGQLGWSILSGIIANWLVFFYQPDAGNTSAEIFVKQGAIFLGLTIIGLIAAAGRIVDAITDPMIAGQSDRCKHKHGRRIPFMRFAAIPFGIVTVLVFFSPVNGESPVNGIFLLVMCLLFYIFMTLYCTPYNALIPALGRTQKDRINISTFISVTYFIGTALAYSLTYLAGLFEGQFGYTNSIRISVGILAVIAVVCMLIPAFAIKEKDYVDVTPTQSKPFESLVKTFKNGEFRKFVLSDILYFVALTMFQTGLPFYITALMGLDSSMSLIFFGLMMVLSLVFYPFVNKLAKKWGKKKLVCFAFFFYAFAFFITTFCGMFGISGMVWGVIVSVLASLPMAILGILPQAIVADIAEYDSIETKENREGMFYAARTFAMKVGQALSMLLFTAIAAAASDGLGYRLSALIAAIICLVGGLVLLKYNEKKVFGVILKPEEKEIFEKEEK